MTRLVMLLHLALAALGLLLGLFVPPSWRLPLFFVAIGFTLATVIAAHAYPEPKVRSRAGTAALFVVSLLLAGPGGEIKRGQASLYFTLALLFTFAYVGGLAIAHYAA